MNEAEKETEVLIFLSHRTLARKSIQVVFMYRKREDCAKCSKTVLQQAIPS